MKIVSRQDFMILPDGVVYMKTSSDYYFNLSIKHATLYDDESGKPIDWFYTDISGISSDEIDIEGTQVCCHWAQTRDACYDDSERFLVLADSIIDFADYLQDNIE